MVESRSIQFLSSPSMVTQYGLFCVKLLLRCDLWRFISFSSDYFRPKSTFLSLVIIHFKNITLSLGFNQILQMEIRFIKFFSLKVPKNRTVTQNQARENGISVISRDPTEQLLSLYVISQIRNLKNHFCHTPSLMVFSPCIAHVFFYMHNFFSYAKILHFLLHIHNSTKQKLMNKF